MNFQHCLLHEVSAFGTALVSHRGVRVFSHSFGNLNECEMCKLCANMNSLILRESWAASNGTKWSKHVSHLESTNLRRKCSWMSEKVGRKFCWWSSVGGGWNRVGLKWSGEITNSIWTESVIGVISFWMSSFWRFWFRPFSNGFPLDLLPCSMSIIVGLWLMRAYVINKPASFRSTAIICGRGRNMQDEWNIGLEECRGSSYG